MKTRVCLKYFVDDCSWKYFTVFLGIARNADRAATKHHGCNFLRGITFPINSLPPCNYMNQFCFRKNISVTYQCRSCNLHMYLVLQSMFRFGQIFALLLFLRVCLVSIIPEILICNWFITSKNTFVKVVWWKENKYCWNVGSPKVEDIIDFIFENARLW